VEEKEQIERLEQIPSAVKHRRGAVLSPMERGDEKEEMDLREYWHVFRKRRWTILSVVLVIFTITLIGTIKERPVYRAQTMLEIEKQNPDVVSVQELFQLENVSDTYLETQYKILKSESLARRVVEALHLEQVKELNPGWVAGPNGLPETTAADPRLMQAVVQSFAARLRVQPIERSRLVLVSFDSEDPNLAAKGANALASSYIEESLEAHWEATQKAREWLSQQLDDLKIKLEKSEDELQLYAKSNALVFLITDKGSTENIANERLRELQDELTKAQADRYQKESLYRLSQAGEYASLPDVADSGLLQNLTLRLAELNTEYARLTTTFSPDFPKVKQQQNQINEVEKALASERKRIASRIANDYAAASRREALVQEAFQAQQKQVNEVTVKAVQYNILKREVDTNKQLYEGLLTRLKEAGVSAGLKASAVRVVDPATPPSAPVKPRVFLNLSLALALGVCCAVGIALFQEHFDNTLKTPVDVERALHLPALAFIPAYQSLNGQRRHTYGTPSFPKPPLNGGGKTPSNGKGWYLIDESGAQSAALREAFRAFRTSVLLSTAGRPPRSLLITSAQPSEGKTTISANLAVSLAQLKQRVLLIDADLRRPNIHKVFHTQPGPGLASYLAGHQDWRDVVVPTVIPGLDIIPCGPLPPNPAELLFSERARTLLCETAEKYTTVVLDSAPVLNVADSRVLSVFVDGVVLVVRGHATPRELVQRAQAQINDAGGNIIGVVLNSVDVRGLDYYSYGNYHYDAYIHDAQPVGEPE
jgi:succinoglycan biosynthesis transport protein ExoP